MPLLSVFSIVHEFSQNSLFSPRSSRFPIFKVGAPLFSAFQQSAGVCIKQRLQPSKSTFCHFRTWPHHFVAFLAKCMTFYETEVLSPRSACFVIFTLGTPLLSVFSKVREFVHNSVFSPRSACFVIFTLGTPLSVFSKVLKFVQNSVLRTRSVCFVIFALCSLLFNSFQQSARVCPKSQTALLARDQPVLSFPHCAHQL